MWFGGGNNIAGRPAAISHQGQLTDPQVLGLQLHPNPLVEGDLRVGVHRTAEPLVGEGIQDQQVVVFFRLDLHHHRAVGHSTSEKDGRPCTSAITTNPPNPTLHTPSHGPIFDLEGGTLGLHGIIVAGEVEYDLVMADNDLLGGGFLAGKGVLEDGLVVLRLHSGVEERIRRRAEKS